MAGYVLLIFQDEAAADAATADERAALHRAHGDFHAKHGARVTAGDALQRTPTARTVRRAPVSAVTDGPFLETKEALGGFYVIEAADLDEAIAVAADVPAPHGGVEIRPVEVFA